MLFYHKTVLLTVFDRRVKPEYTIIICRWLALSWRPSWKLKTTIYFILPWVKLRDRNVGKSPGDQRKCK